MSTWAYPGTIIFSQNTTRLAEDLYVSPHRHVASGLDDRDCHGYLPCGVD